MEAIKADCIDIGKGMGLHLDTSLTPSNATWWNPVTASQSNQGTKLKQDLESYIKFHTVENSALTELMKSRISISITKQEETASIPYIFSLLNKSNTGFSLCFKAEGFFYAQNQERTV